MSPPDISRAKDPDVRSAMQALRRAAQLARQTAIQTGTNLIVVRNGQIQHIPPATLRDQVTAKQ